MANSKHVEAFRKGNEAIGALLKKLQKSREPLDLRGVTINGGEKGLKVRGHYLQGVDLRGATLRNVHFEYMMVENLEADRSTKLEGCHLTGSKIGNTWLAGTTLTTCCFNDKTVLGNAYLSGATLSNCTFTNVILDRAHFVGAKMIKVQFEECSFCGAAFAQAQLTGSHFQRCHFSKESLEQITNALGEKVKRKVREPLLRKGVFLSYDTKRQKLVDVLKGMVDGKRFYFVDQWSLPRSKPLATEIVRLIKTTDAFVAIVSCRHALKKGGYVPSPWVLDEVAAAVALKKKVLERVVGFGVHQQFHSRLAGENAVNQVKVCRPPRVCGCYSCCYERCPEDRWRDAFRDLVKDLENQLV